MPKTFLIPQSIKLVNNLLIKRGFGPLPLRNMQMAAQLAKAGLVNDSLVQWYQAAHGVTTNAGTVSQWLNLAPSRLALNKNLTQLTTASQPTYLPHSGGVGNNYAYLNGTAGTYASTPNAVPLQVTGDIDIRVRVALNDYTPATDMELVTKYNNAGNQRGYRFGINIAGTLYLDASSGGSLSKIFTSTVPCGIMDFSTTWLRATLDVDDGASHSLATFYTSNDGSTWIMLGAVVSSTAENIFNSNAPVEIGSRAGGAGLAIGNFYRAQIYAGLTGTDLRFDFNPATYVSGTTFTDSSVNAATITLNGGTVVNTFSSLYFDGVDDFLKTGPFTLNQPTTVYFMGKQATWTVSRRLFDGNTASMIIFDITGSPNLTLNAGSSLADITTFALQTNGILSAVGNAATSSIRHNRNAAVTGNAGTNNMNGFTLGAASAGGTPSNITVSEILVFNTAHRTVQQDIVIGYLNSKYSLGL